ncbi:MAG: trypsin-like peptidase domain-containing protein [Tenericutes bacterium]|nr:trypsin-like peptidase domain-containing protein [Mycoplasmatota bacterium]
MKVLRKFLVVFIILLTTFMVSCDQFFVFETTTPQEMNITTLPSTVNGPLTFENEDYNSFSIYTSATYAIDSVTEYNAVLANTRDYIRHANISIHTTLYEMRYPFPFSKEEKEYIVGNSSGSGFVFLEKDGYFYSITNFHVVNPTDYNARYSILTYSDEEPVEATLIAYNEDYDLAVLKFAVGERDDVTVIDIYERLYYKFNSNELVFAVGNPQGVTNNVTFGEFNSMQSIDNTDFQVIYHNATIDEGSSGGALVDVDGNLLGVNAWGLESVDEFSFAIPNYIVYIFLINNGVLD